MAEDQTQRSKCSPGFTGRLKTDLQYRERLVRTIWICWSFAMLGWVEALMGPTLPDLQLLLEIDLETAAWLFTATSGGYLLGSLLSWLLYDRYSTIILMTGSILGTAVTTVIVPWSEYFPAMVVVRLFGGAFAASLDTGGNAHLVSIWGLDSGPYMQALHFCFSTGGIISPLVAEPFLAKRICNHPPIDEYANSSLANTNAPNGTAIDIVGNNRTKCITNFSETKIHYAYLISAILILLTALPFVVILCRGKETNRETKEKDEDSQAPRPFDSLRPGMRALLLFLLSLLMFFYCAAEDTYAGFLMTFTLTQLSWRKVKGSLATSVHWATFSAGRLVGIVIVRYVRTVTLMFVFSIFLVLAFVALLIVTVTGMDGLVWLFIGVIGISMSVLFPSVFTWTTESVTAVSGKVSAMFLTGSSTGIMLSPLLFGYMMEQYSPMWFLYLLIGLTVVWLILLCFTYLLTKILLKPAKVIDDHCIQTKELLHKEKLKSLP